MRYVIIPGIGGSGPEHWQSRWQDAWGERATRIRPASWDQPELDDWLRAVESAVGESGEESVLVAHSLGCLAASVWLNEPRPQIRGAFLVAAPSVRSQAFPAAEAASFVPIVPARLTVPALVVGSEDDPYCDPESARQNATAWNADYVSIGSAGHINAASGLGAWPHGRALLTAFVSGLGLGPGTGTGTGLRPGSSAGTIPTH